MSESVKKPKSSILLYLLIVVTALVLLCAATILYLTFNSGDNSNSDELTAVNTTSSSLFLPSTPSTPAKPTATSSIPNAGTRPPPETPVTAGSTPAPSTTTSDAPQPEKPPSTVPTQSSTVPTTPTETQEVTTPEGSTSTAETSTSTGTTTTTTVTSTTTVDELVTPPPNQHGEMIDRCSLIAAQDVTCAKTRDDVITLSPSALSPLHYTINFTVQTVTPTVIEGDLQLFLRINEQGKQVSLDVDSKLRNVDDLRVVNCDTGATLCVAKTVFDQREQLLSIILSDVVPEGTNLRVDVRRFTSVDNHDITYSQIAPRWNRNAPVMVGTLLGAGAAKRLFPGLENPAHRATLDLCVKFTPAGHVRSNSATKFVDGAQTCFERTVPLAVQQMAFAGFEKAETLIHNKTVLDGTPIPAVEIVFSLNKNFKREKHQWIYSETSRVMSLMSQWTGFPYPLEALRVISAPIRASSHSSLGLITLQDRLVEHPTYTLAHVTLIHSVIQQWISGVLSLAKNEDACFAESLTTYLEWKLNDELRIVNKSLSAEIESIRPLDLSAEIAGGDEPRRIRSTELSHSCPERFISIFYTIDETFGRDTVKNTIKYMLHKHAYTAVQVSDWEKAVIEVTGNEHAGQMLREWFSRKTRPVLQLTVSPKAVQFEQMTDDDWTVPVEIAGSSGVHLAAVTEKSLTLPYSSNDYVIADPARKSTAMIIYDADSYIRLIRCWDDTRCPANRDALRGIIRDLVAVLLTDRLPAPQLIDIPKWKAVFKFARGNRLLSGNAACCSDYAISRTVEIACTWVVRDTCEKIRLFNTVATTAGV